MTGIVNSTGAKSGVIGTTVGTPSIEQLPTYISFASGFAIQYYSGLYNSASTLTFDLDVFASGATNGNIFYFKAGCNHYTGADYHSYREGYITERGTGAGAGNTDAVYGPATDVAAMGEFTIAMASSTICRVTKAPAGAMLGHGFVIIMGRALNI